MMKRCVAEEIFMQIIEGVVWVLSITYSKRQEDRDKLKNKLLRKKEENLKIKKKKSSAYPYCKKMKNLVLKERLRMWLNSNLMKRS